MQPLGVEWVAPKPEELDLKFAFGDSVLTEFILGHDSSAVLREVVQNEYDAEGSHMEVNFGQDHLLISGTGKPISRDGWKRLSVVLGTGTVNGSHQAVAPKVNGLGSKNFGLRSLFIFGNTIYVRSNGLQTVLDLARGASPSPLPDQTSEELKGVRIVVPYRVETTGRLQPFGPDAQARAFDDIIAELSYSLIKLVQPKDKKGIRSVAITSEQLDRQVKWSQAATLIPCKAPTTRLLRRRVRLTDSREPKAATIEQLEWQKTVLIPPEHQKRRLPRYFQLPGGRVRIGISLPAKLNKAAREKSGICYYPLGIPGAVTGNLVSICAPFELNSDRSQIIAPVNSPWNEWLLDQAVSFTIDLLKTDWLDRLGPNAYLALKKVAQPTFPNYLEGVHTRLHEEACWATRARDERKRPVFETAKQIVVPKDEVLDGILSERRYLDDRIGKSHDVQEMAISCGAPVFGVNSLVRLRCAGKDEKALSTKLKKGEANYYYTALPSNLRNVDIQVELARRLNALQRFLSRENRNDLSSAPTTLTAGGVLKAPTAPIWLVDAPVVGTSAVPDSDRLHDSLVQFRVISKLCKPFDPEWWARGVVEKIAGGTASEEEREALYHLILQRHGRFKSSLRALICRSPVLRDHRGEWTAPLSMVVRNRETEQLGLAIHFPHKDYAKDKELITALRFRDRVAGADLVTYAQFVSAHPEAAPRFESLLIRHRRLLRKAIIEELSSIKFLESSHGGLEVPPKLYVRNPRTEKVLGESVPYANSKNRRLYVLLGCQLNPLSEDIVSQLRSLSQQGHPPEDLELTYTTLVEALKREGRSPRTYQHETILWSDTGYSRPADTLIGSAHKKVFLEAVPQLSKPSQRLASAYDSLGAQRRPDQEHWKQLYQWFDKTYGRGSQRLPKSRKSALLEAYRRTQHLHIEVPPDTKYLMDDEQFLHSRKEAEEGHLVIDDDPALAAEIRQQSLPLHFAETANNSVVQFYRSVGVRVLTDVRKQLQYYTGKSKPPPGWISTDSILQSLTDPAYGSALSALIAQEHRSRVDSEQIRRAVQRLRRISRIAFVDEISAEYRIARARVQVPTRVALEGDVIYLSRVKSKNDLYSLLAQAVAGLFSASSPAQRLLVDGIYRVFTCDSLKDLKMFLFERGVRWKPPSSAREEELDEEERNEENLLQQQLGLLTSTLVTRIGAKAPPSSGTPSPTKPTPPRLIPPRTLPPIDTVTPSHTASSVEWSPAQPGSRSGARGGGGGTWQPPTGGDKDWDCLIGQRGEELVYRQEVKRVEALGYSASHVVCVSKDDPGADHDIKSIDEDGKDLWIEVKSTTGKDGRFSWSRSEFAKAVAERDRYVLWRVYEADTATPILKSFRDPVKMFLRQGMRLDFASFYAEVEPAHT